MSRLDDLEAMQNDLRDLLDALGMFSGARSQSPHEVMGEAIEEVKTLRERTSRLEEALRAGRWALEDEAMPLIRELVDDLKRFYTPEKGWPPHIEKALDPGDLEQVVKEARAALESESRVLADWRGIPDPDITERGER